MAARSIRLHLGHCLTRLAAHTEQMAHGVNWRLEDMMIVLVSAFGPGHSMIATKDGMALGQELVWYDLSGYYIHLGQFYDCLLFSCVDKKQSQYSRYVCSTKYNLH